MLFSDKEVVHKLSADKLIHILSSIAGKKHIYVDRSLMRPLDRLLGVSLFKKHDVDKIFRLDDTMMSFSTDINIVLLVRCSVARVKFICRLLASNQHLTCCHVILTPKVLHIARTVFEQEGFYGRVKLYDYSLGFIQLDTDLWSLETPEFFADYHLHSQTHLIACVAKCLWELQSLCGHLFPRIRAVGPASHQLFELLKAYGAGCDSHCTASRTVPQLEVGRLFVMDRGADLPACLLTQYTYGALLARYLHVEAGALYTSEDACSEVPGDGDTKAESVSDTPPVSAADTKFLLNSTDTVYRDTRDLHIANVFPHLRRCTRDLQKENTSRKEMDVVSMRHYIKNELSSVQSYHRSISTHISFCERILTHTRHAYFSLDDDIMQDPPTGQSRDCLCTLKQLICSHHVTSVCDALRVLCLHALMCADTTSTSADSTQITELVTALCHSYGFRHVISLHRLQRACLLPPHTRAVTQTKASCGGAPLLNRPQAGARKLVNEVVRGFHSISSHLLVANSTTHRLLSRRLRLFPPGASQPPDTAAPQCASYVYGGLYVPLCCRLLEAELDGQWRTQTDIVREVTGTCVVTHDQLSVETSALPPCLLFLFLGGVSMAELAALKFVARCRKCQVVVMTTNVIGRYGLLSSIVV